MELINHKGKYYLKTELGYQEVLVSTDKSLVVNGKLRIFEKESFNLSQIPQSFIEQYITEYNKGNIISDVLVEYEEIGGKCQRSYCLDKGMLSCSAMSEEEILSDIMNPKKLDINKLDEYMDNYHKVYHTNPPEMVESKLGRRHGKCGRTESYLTLKINADNTINIKTVKDSFSREEVVDLITKAISETNECNNRNVSMLPSKFIEQNL